MTLLTVCQNVARHPSVGQPVPSTVMTATGQFEIELVGLLPKAVRYILEYYEWRLLTTLATFSGDASTTSFSLPSDYNRFLKKAALFSTASQIPLEKIDDMDVWLDRIVSSFTGSVGYWTVLGGYVQIKPALASGASAKVYYISNAIVAPASGSNKAAFTLDTDTFRLDEYLLELELIWRWRAAKGLEYSEDMQEAQIALSKAASKDRGPRTLRVGPVRVGDDVQLAWPVAIDA